MATRDDSKAPRASLLHDLITQLFTSRARIDAQRYANYNGFIGLILLAGTLALHFSRPPDPLGPVGFALALAGAVVLLAALVVPAARPRLVPALLAVQGGVIVALTIGFALGCVVWALGTPATQSFRYLPGPIVVGMSYGAAQWADFGRARERPRPWRLAGFFAGLALELVVAVFVVRALFG